MEEPRGDHTFRGLKASDEDAYVDFAAATGPRLMRSAVLMCGDWHLAEDLTQTTLAKVYASWRRVAQADNPEAYARGVLTKTYLSHRRLRRSGEVPSDPVTTPWRGDRQEAPDHDVVLRRTLVDAMRELSHTDRAVLVLRYFNDCSVAETAALTGLGDNTVKSRSARALKRLRGLMEEGQVRS